MQLTDAQKTALPTLLAKISAMTQVVDVLQALANDTTATITGGVSVSTAAQGNASLQLPAMSAQESAPFFAAALTAYQARLAALNDQLAAL